MLTIELVPKTAWYTNLRSELSKDKWDELRRITYKRANYICEICGGVGDKYPVECHEEWEYDDVNHIQKLIKLIALCPKCHKVKHIELSKIRGEYDSCLLHLMRVNNWNLSKAEEYIQESFKIWEERSKHKWVIG